jgi:hypothetical protein
MSSVPASKTSTLSPEVNATRGGKPRRQQARRGCSRAARMESGAVDPRLDHVLRLAHRRSPTHRGTASADRHDQAAVDSRADASDPHGYILRPQQPGVGDKRRFVERCRAMDADDILHSPLEQSVTRGDVTVRICIYRGPADSGWLLEVEDHRGGSTLWDDPFPSDRDALDEAMRTIEAEGIRTFADSGPSRT